ncbi:glutamate receptor-like isoform X1 [Octopus vulgaris]|uniref:Glutamate receptor-like isoform X1 n=1 Tax=Octopus vulgaris TaxID=6645 RepID=A0AA36BH37_OCTVU|nr:glutamate receptor-like isoform X1 [Octopus vulgaris]
MSGLMRVQQLFQVMGKSEHQVTLNVKRATDVNSSYAILKDLHEKEPEINFHTVLDMSIQMASNLMKQLSEDTKGIQELNLKEMPNYGCNVSGFQLVDFNNMTVKVFLSSWLTIDPTEWPGAGVNTITYEAALAVDAVSLFTRAMKNLSNNGLFESLFIRSKSGTNSSKSCATVQKLNVWNKGKIVLKAMKETEFDGLTGRVAFDARGHRRDFTLDVLDLGVTQGVMKIGYWTQNEGLVILKRKIVRDPHENNAENRTRIVTTIQADPYIMEKPQPVNGHPLIGNDKYEGYCVDLARKVAHEVGFDYVFQMVRDGSYGSKLPNDSWNGMVGELIRLEADMAIAPLTISAVRERVIDFSKPFMSLGISIMIKKPADQKAHVFSFLDPLSYEIWMCILFAFIGVSVVLFLVSRFSPNEWHVEDESNITNDFTISNSLWFSLGAFMQQGCDFSPRSISGRIVGSVWWFFTLIIISSYTANLAAFLTVERMSTPIESAEDLAKQTEIEYGTLRSGTTEAFFKTSKVAVYERMWAYMTSKTPSVFTDKIDEGINRVRQSNGKYAFLVESATNDYINNRYPCDTMKVGSNLDSKGFGIATPAGSDLGDKLTLAVLKLREDGELDKLQKFWWVEKGQCTPQDKNTDGGQSALTLSNVAGIFYILIVGLVLAIIVAVAEYLYKSKLDSKKSKTSFGLALKSNARLSFRGHPAREDSSSGTPLRKSMSTYTYSGPSQSMGFDTVTDGNTHTQV